MSLEGPSGQMTHAVGLYEMVSRAGMKPARWIEQKGKEIAKKGKKKQ